MDNSNFWWQAAGVDPGPGPGPDAGDPIGQSLRFRGAQTLSKNFPTVAPQTHTFAVWLKLGELSATATQSKPNFYSIGELRAEIDNTNNSILKMYGGSGWINQNGGAFYRDPSAWYHFVCQFDNGQCKQWMNGQPLQLDNPSAGFNPVTKDFVLGSEAAGLATPYNFTGYMAAVYFIDGQALEPTAFGRYNAQGVWVPVDPQGLTYGSNGFKLTFEDPSDLGKDYSGNGNDFTATGFETASYVNGWWLDPSATSTQGGDFPNNQGGPYFIDATGGTNLSPIDVYSIENMVNGDTSFNGSNQPNSMYFSDVGGGYPRSFLFDLRDYVGNLNVVDAWVFQQTSQLWDVFLLDENKNEISGSRKTVTEAYNSSNNVQRGWVNLPVSGSPRYIQFGDVGNTSSIFVGAIRINGQILTQVPRTNEDYDLMQDSPTQNYATYNPLGFNNGSLSASITLKSANLDFTVSSNPDLGFTIFTIPRSGRYYFELQSPSTEVGLRLYAPKEDNEKATGNGNLADIYNKGTRWLVTNNSGGLAPNASVNKTGSLNTQVVIDADTHRIYLGDSTADNWLYNDGGGTYTLGAFDAARPSIDYSTLDEYARNNAQLAVNGQPGVSANFGQQPFVMPIPAGWDANTVFQTQNLPAAPILDGRDHFQAITGPGQGADSGVAGQVPGAWSSMLYNTSATAPDFNSTTQVFSSAATFGFDGSTSTFYVPSGQRWIWRPDTPINNVTKIEMYCGAGNTHWINESPLGNSTATGGQFNTIYDGAAFTLTNLAGQFGPTANGSAGFAQLKINGELYIDGNILAIAQQTFPNGLWWIKDRANTNQHQLVDSVRGGNSAINCPSLTTQAYVAPAGESVAWCWNAPEAWSDNSGTIAATGQRNLDAGFSIVSYTGNGTQGATVAHGLDRAPTFAIVKNTSINSNNIVVGSDASSWDKVLFLNQQAAQEPSTTVYFASTPSDTVLNLGNSQNTNNSGSEIVAYCWHSVPGYSAFGSYKGNGNADGPFIYTGMRVAVVIAKSSTSAQNWVIYDSTRAPNNPNNACLFPNDPAGEPANTRPLDLLSNGFKIRTDANQVNTSGQTYIYAAFAENPFQSPATAR